MFRDQRLLHAKTNGHECHKKAFISSPTAIPQSCSQKWKLPSLSDNRKYKRNWSTI